MVVSQRRVLAFTDGCGFAVLYDRHRRFSGRGIAYRVARASVLSLTFK